MTGAETDTSRQRLLVALQWAFTLATVVGIVWYLAPSIDEIAAVSQVTGSLLLIIAAGLLLHFLAHGMVFKLFVEHFDIPMPISQAVLVGLMDTTLNYLPMKAGTVATGMVLVRRYGVHVGDFAAIVAGSTLLNIWLSAAVSGLCLFALKLRPSLALSVIVLPTLVVVLLMTWGRTHQTRAIAGESSSLRRGASRVVSGVALIFRSPSLVAGLTGVNLVRLGAVALVLYASFAAVAHPVSSVEALAIAGLAFVLGRLSILPGGLGFREAGIAATAALIGIPSVFGLAAAVIDRGAMVVALMVFGIPATVFMLTRSQTSLAGTPVRLGGSAPGNMAVPETRPVGNYYDKYSTRNPVSRRLMNRFRADLDDLWRHTGAHSQLDVGCGEGVITFDWAVSLNENRIVGLDKEDERLRAEWASRSRPNLEFVSGDAVALRFDDDEFELVSAIEVLEHLPDPHTALAEMKRVADRYLLLSVPREPLWRLLNMLRGVHWSALGNTPGHVQHWSRAGFLQFVSGFGEVIAVRLPVPWTIVLIKLDRSGDGQ